MEAGDAIKHLATHRTAITTKSDLIQCIIGVEVEKF